MVLGGEWSPLMDAFVRITTSIHLLEMALFAKPSLYYHLFLALELCFGNSRCLLLASKLPSNGCFVSSRRFFGKFT